MSCMINPVE